jgi:nucleoid-associated protein YgaU
MAAPQFQTDLSLPRRTAIQPALAVGKVTGSEKDLTEPQPAEKEKPAAPVDSAAARPLAAAPVEREKVDQEKVDKEKVDKEKEDIASVPDWGFLKKKPGGRSKLKIAIAAGVVALSTCGYAAYFWLHESSTTDGSEASTADDPAARDALADTSDSFEPSDESGDPFDNTPKTAASEGRRFALDDEPRRVPNSADAMPIRKASRSASAVGASSGRHPLASDDEIELPEDLDAAALEQSEPAVDEEQTSGPSLAGPSRSVGKPASTGRPLLMDEPPKTQPGASARGASLSQTGKAARDGDPSDEALEGFTIVERKQTGGTRGPSGSPAISIVDARDDDNEDLEELDGFVAKEPNSRRAASRTLVVRSSDAAGRSAAGSSATRGADSTGSRRNSAPAAGIDGDESFDDARRLADNRDSISGRSGAIGGRRSAPPLPSADDRFSGISSRSPGARGASSAGASPAGESYRVAPDDTFWKISRKQYGTARYFQALARHNQERVPDPSRLRPGTLISTPTAAVLEQRYPELIERSANYRGKVDLGADSDASAPRFEKPALDDELAQRPDPAEGKAGASGYFYGKNGAPMYRIGSDDTLTGIAQRCLGRASRWSEIYEQNRDVLDNPDDLKLGTVIRLPSDASRVGLVPEGGRRR